MESRNSSALKNKNKIVVILGPTSSGKSDVAIELAQKFNGEIISADSRQVYKFLDIGAGKVTSEEQKMAPHHLLDVVHPNDTFNASHFKKEADRKIEEILKKGKIPILCGGTGFWIKSVIDNVSYPEVKPDPELRKELDKNTAEELFEILKEKDPERAKSIDPQNKVRLIRAIEICQSLGKVPKLKCHPKLACLSNRRVSGSRDKNEKILKPVQHDNNYQSLQIGISWTREKLNERIKTRLEKRFSKGMIEEVKNLHQKNGVTWKRIKEFGLGYLWIAKYFQKEIQKDEIFEKVYQAEKNYAKRQMTWFQKDKRIVWLEKHEDIEKAVRKFLKS